MLRLLIQRAPRYIVPILLDAGLGGPEGKRRAARSRRHHIAAEGLGDDVVTHLLDLGELLAFEATRHEGGAGAADRAALRDERDVLDLLVLTDSKIHRHDIAATRVAAA